MASQLETGTKTAVVTETITGATQANPVVITVTGTALRVGDWIFITGVVGMTEINDRRFKVSIQNTNDVALEGEDGTGHTAWGSGGTQIVGNIRHPLKASAPQTPRTTAGVHDLWVDLGNMVAGDSLFVWLRETAGDGGTERWYQVMIANHQQGDATEMPPSDPFNFQHDWNFYIEQWAGAAGRAFIWSIRAP